MALASLPTTIDWFQVQPEIGVQIVQYVMKQVVSERSFKPLNRIRY